MFTGSEGEGGGDAPAGSAGCVPVACAVPGAVSCPRVVGPRVGRVDLSGGVGGVVCGPVSLVRVVVVACAVPWPGRVGWVSFCHPCPVSLLVCLKGQVGTARVSGLPLARPFSLLSFLLPMCWSVLRASVWRHTLFPSSAWAVWCTLKNVVCGSVVTFCVPCGALVEPFVSPLAGTLITFWR